jgi:hypothetical protein
MPPIDPPDWTIEIVPPGGQATRPDRRRSAAAFRPYSPLDGSKPGAPAVGTDRRRRRRGAADLGRGRMIDLES